MRSVNDVMTFSVFVAAPGDSAYACLQKMSEKNISCLVVVDQDHPIGIVTRRDVIEKVVVPKKNVEEITVHEIMTTPLVTFAQNGFVLDLFNIMVERGIKQIPIVNDGKELVGVVTQTDLVRAVYKMLVAGMSTSLK